VPTVPELLDTLWQLVIVLSRLGAELLLLGLSWSLLLAWVAWWTFGVNWQKTWKVLAQGAWVPLVLLSVTGAFVWSRIAPTKFNFLNLLVVPNFWWQLVGVGLLVGLTLFCGWVQGVLGWTPAEVSLEPPAPSGHDHHPHH
jgi:hypothetical protein